MRLALLLVLVLGTTAGGWVALDLSRKSAGLYAFEAFAINARGQAIGTGTHDWSYERSFIFTGGKVVDLGVLAGTVSTRAAAINGRGDVAGAGSTTAGISFALLWQRGTLQRLASVESDAVALNDAGQVVGWAKTAIGARHAVLWQGGRMRDLGTLGGAASAATAINRSGQIVGWSETRNRTRHAFLWQHGRMRDLGSRPGSEASEAVAVNARGDVLAVAEGQRVFVWRAGKRATVGTFALSRYSSPYESHGYPLAMNDAGAVVGTFVAGDREARPLLWVNGRTTYLPVAAGAKIGGAVGVNRRGDIVGWTALTADPTAGTHAVVWSGGRMTDLTGSSQPDETHSLAGATNDAGQIVGTVTARMESARAMLWTH